VHLEGGTEAKIAELNQAGKPLDVSGCNVFELPKVFDSIPIRNGLAECKGLIADGLRGERVLNLRSAGTELPVRIDGPLSISSSTLKGLYLHEVHITGKCNLDRLDCDHLDATGMTCDGAVSVNETHVSGSTDFSDATVKSIGVAGALEGLTSFQGATVSEGIDLRGAVLSSALTLVGAKVGQAVAIGGGKLDSLDMRGVVVGGHLEIPNLSITGEVDCSDAEIGGADWSRARLMGQTDFSGAVIGGEHANLQGLSAQLRVDIRVTSDTVDLSGAHFRDGLDLRLGDSAIRLDETRFDAPSLVSGPPLAEASVVSIAGARSRNLALSHVDLSNCLMEGAAELDQLELGDGVEFPHAPQAILGCWGARGRQVIANDIEWRQGAHPRSMWASIKRPTETHPKALQRQRASQPSSPEIEELYRSLRIARERGGNSPGAASFYYGEMEMRRLRPWSSGWDEKLIVWLYWVLSGYGLRASRSLVALAAFWALGAFFFLNLGGFLDHPSIFDTLVFTASSSLAFLHEPPNNLTVTTSGEAAQLVLRTGTAVLLALATLALRGRVKR
jgi:uncharacterized protein YjbI with pentapeptide repeats